MTLTKGDRARRSHVPAAGTEHAAAVERAQREMLHEGSSTVAVRTSERGNRPRIGADVVCEALLRQGVDVFFSYPGGVILPLYDILGDYPELRHVLVRHEQGGAHAADGYARVTRKVGVCMGTSGPGDQGAQMQAVAGHLGVAGDRRVARTVQRAEEGALGAHTGAAGGVIDRGEQSQARAVIGAAFDADRALPDRGQHLLRR